ncbi:MAG TPA: ABC transporter substrate-binding protein [Candidatus Limnocylindrales bacterium]|nr:ABC transporter substrate-binding protein [Candidatus Limnocylindrales bacterium]
MLLAIVLAACSAAPAATPTLPPTTPFPSTAPVATQEPTAAPTEAPTPAPLFPVELTDDEGGTTTIAAEPARIVSLTPAATEILFELGAGDRLVGKVEDFTPYPEAAAAIPDVAKFGSVDVEKIVSLGTELVVAGGNNFNPPESIKQLRDLGVPVLVVFAPDIAGALKDIELIGKAVGRPEEAAGIAAAITAAMDEVKAATAGQTPIRTYYELDASSGFFGPAPDYFGTEMIRIAGGDPLTSGTPGVYQIEAEQILTFDPEVILLGDAAYGVTPEQVVARPGWDTLTAVKNGDVRPIDDVIVTRPGPRLADGIRALAVAINPDLVLPSPAP